MHRPCIQRHVDERHMAFSSSMLQRGSNTFVGLRFWGVSWHQSINHTNSTRVRFIRSATPYCSGVLIGCCHLMMHPSGLEELLELCGCVCPPRSVHRTFHLCPLSFSTGAFHFWNLSKTSLFCFKTYTHE